MTAIEYEWTDIPDTLVLWSQAADAMLLYKFTVTGFAFLNDVFALTRTDECEWDYSGDASFPLAFTWESYSKAGDCPDILQGSGSGTTNASLAFGDPSSGFPTSVIHQASAKAFFWTGAVGFSLGPTFTSSGNNCGTAAVSWTNDPPGDAGGNPCSGFSPGTTYSGTATNTENACGCCDGVWTPTGGTVTFSNRYGLSQDGNCYNSSAEALASDQCIKKLLTDLVIDLQQVAGIAGCGLLHGANQELLDDVGSEPVAATFDPVSECAGIAGDWALSCDIPTHRSYLRTSYGGSGVLLIDYETGTLTLVIREDEGNPNGYTDFLLQYSPGGSLCNTSFALTLGDFTIVEYTQSEATSSVALRAETLAIAVDIVVTGG